MARPLGDDGVVGYSRLPMSHRVLLSLIALAALAMVALSLVWPQGLGRRSPAPFGHEVAPPPRTARSAK